MIINYSRLIKMFRIFLFVGLLITIFCQNSFAAQLPRYLGSERKFRSYIFNPNDVYRYIGHYTYQGFIEFAEDETIATISMGDPSLWLFENLGNRLFLKPVGEDFSETNMTVITNKKVYHFELLAREAKGITDQDLIFVVKFIYPDDKDKNIVQFPKIPISDEPDLRDLSIYNFNYQYTGEPSIAPIRVFDNGEFTYFQFSKRSAEIPAIFTVDAQGYESLVNYRAAGEYIIVERLAPQYTLRNGSDIVCVYNMTTYSSGRSTSSKKDKNAPRPMSFASMPAQNSGSVAPMPISAPAQMPVNPAFPSGAAQGEAAPVMDVPPGFPADMLPPGFKPTNKQVKMPGTFF